MPERNLPSLMRRRRAVVVVVGDLGRSPRMLAHAGELLRAGYDVHLVGVQHTPLPPALQDNPNVSLHALDAGARGAGTGLAAVLAMVRRGVQLTVRLARLVHRAAAGADLVLLQNPPALPTIPVALVCARRHRAKLVIDWHNYGWAILGLRFGPTSSVVRITRWLELRFARMADAHVAVSDRMAQYLETVGIGPVSVLHDAQSALRPFPRSVSDPAVDPITIVAPMGWSQDDDLPLLEQVVRSLYELAAASPAPRRPLRLLVSGHGPRRDAWGPRLRALSSDGLVVETPDVPATEYPQLLASSHCGLSLHRSASQHDLPMKVVEFRAAGLPALVLEDGSPIGEIAPPGCGVTIYRSAADLATLLDAMRSGRGDNLLARLQEEARAQPPGAWEDYWPAVFQRVAPD